MIDNLRDVLFNLGYTRLISDGQYYRMAAIYRGGNTKTSLAVNKKTGRFTDFGVGVNGSLDELAKLTLKDEDLDVEEFFKNHSIDIDDLKIHDEPKIEMERTWDSSILTYLMPHYKFYNDKGISDETLKRLRSGFCHSGEMNQRYVFPIFNKEGKIHGISGRDMIGSRDVKWKHLGRKTSWIYPAFMFYEEKLRDGSVKRIYPVLEAIAATKKIILVESIGDMMKFWDRGEFNVLVTFGLKLSSKLLSFIGGQIVDEVIIATNNDNDPTREKNNGKEGSLIMFLQLMEWVDITKLKIVLPLANDFGEMTDDQFIQWHNKTKTIRKDIMYSAILKKMEEMHKKGKLSKTQYKLAFTIKRFNEEEKLRQVKSV